MSVAGGGTVIPAAGNVGNNNALPMAQLADGWLELESDPGLFTLLLEDFGCKGIVLFMNKKY